MELWPGRLNRQYRHDPAPDQAEKLVSVHSVTEYRRLGALERIYPLLLHRWRVPERSVRGSKHRVGVVERRGLQRGPKRVRHDVAERLRHPLAPVGLDRSRATQ